ncbi:MAG: S1C family serine protease [Acidimicrobiia bacterium]
MFTSPPTGSPYWTPSPPTAPIDPAPAPAPARARRSRAGTAARAIAVSAAIAVAAVGGGVVGAVATRADLPATTAAAPEATGEPATPVVASGAMNVGAVLQTVGRSVVEITAQVVEREGFRAQRGTAVGTGVIISSDGKVLTNAHVVNGAQTVQVAVAGERTPRAARVVAADKAADIALVELSGPANLHPATLGNSDGVHVGDDVIAIGDALALEGSPTVTRGIVSALNRSVEGENGTMTGMIQIDAAISSGNSGGPLVNAAGQVIGINTMVAASSQNQAANNIGFAISINSAKATLQQLAG